MLRQSFNCGMPDCLEKSAFKFNNFISSRTPITGAREEERQLSQAGDRLLLLTKRGTSSLKFRHQARRHGESAKNYSHCPSALLCLTNSIFFIVSQKVGDHRFLFFIMCELSCLLENDNGATCRCLLFGYQFRAVLLIVWLLSSWAVGGEPRHRCCLAHRSEGEEACIFAIFKCVSAKMNATDYKRT